MPIFFFFLKLGFKTLERLPMKGRRDAIEQLNTNCICNLEFLYVWKISSLLLAQTYHNCSCICPIRIIFVGFWKGSWKIWNNFFSIVTKIIIYRYFAAVVPFNDFWPNNHMTRLFRNAEIRKYLQQYLNVLMTEGLEQNFEWPLFCGIF